MASLTLGPGSVITVCAVFLERLTESLIPTHLIPATVSSNPEQWQPKLSPDTAGVLGSPEKSDLGVGDVGIWAQIHLLY